MHLTPTPNGPIGPFFHFALTADDAAGVMAGPDTQGERIRLAVRVLDSAGAPITNAMIELWQADANGIHRHPDDPGHADADPAFNGFGRLASDDQGLCMFDTVKPGRVESQAPHISVSVYMPGLLRRVTTRIYFADDPANEADPTLNLVLEDRRPTLLARSGAVAGEWTFDLHLAGAGETVFFDV